MLFVLHPMKMCAIAENGAADKQRLRINVQATPIAALKFSGIQIRDVTFFLAFAKTLAAESGAEIRQKENVRQVVAKTQPGIHMTCVTWAQTFVL